MRIAGSGPKRESRLECLAQAVCLSVCVQFDLTCALKRLGCNAGRLGSEGDVCFWSGGRFADGVIHLNWLLSSPLAGVVIQNLHSVSICCC